MIKTILTLGILITTASISYGQTYTGSYFNVTNNSSYGIRFYGGSNEYKIHYGFSNEFKYGPVTSSAIKNSTAPWGGKGWSWGISGAQPVAAIGNNGDMSIKGNFFTEKKMSIGFPYNSSGIEYQLEIKATNKAIKIDADPTANWNYGIRVNVNGYDYLDTYKAFAVWKGTTQVFTVQGDGTTRIGNVLYAQEIFVQNDVWPDFVFKKDYSLSTLYDVEKFILENNHLPDVPSAKEVEANGVGVSDMSAILLQKIEELTLYTIEQQKKIDELEKLIKQ